MRSDYEPHSSPNAKYDEYKWNKNQPSICAGDEFGIDAILPSMLDDWLTRRRERLMSLSTACIRLFSVSQTFSFHLSHQWGYTVEYACMVGLDVVFKFSLQQSSSYVLSKFTVGLRHVYNTVYARSCTHSCIIGQVNGNYSFVAPLKHDFAKNYH